MSEQPATESLSMDDRILAAFEPEQPETEAPAEQPQEAQAEESEAQPEFEEVEFEGERYQVPPKLKDALLRQSDYTKKTTEVAERQRAIEQKELQIRAVEAERAFHDSVKDDIREIQKIDFQLEQWKAVDVTGMNSEQLWQLQRQIEQLKDKRAEIGKGVDGKWNAFQADRNKLAQEALTKAQENVAKAIKGWGPESAKAIREYALAEGYTAPELDSLSDPRLVKTLWKAQQFDKLQTQTIQGKVKSIPTVKPGSSNPMPQDAKDRLALNKIKTASSSAQKAKGIEAVLMNRF